MAQLDPLLNPFAHVRDPFTIQANAWVHPQYVLRQMEYVLPGGERFYCPLLGRPARSIHWKLDAYLNMIPESVTLS